MCMVSQRSVCKLRVLFWGFVLINMLPVGAAGDADITVWPVDALTKVLRDSAIPSKPDTIIRVDAVQNEYESAQVVVTSKRDISNLKVEVGPVSGPSGVKPHIEARFLGYVPVKGGTINTPPEHLIAKPPVDLPDPLLESLKVSVPAGKNQPVWLRIFVPKGTSPGTFSADLKITADSTSVTVPISIRVHPVVMPDERTLYLTNWISFGNIAAGHEMEAWSEPFWKMVESYARCMADYRQNMIISHIFQLVQGQHDGNGNYSFDFSRFDRWVEVFIKAGVVGYIEGGHLACRRDGWESKELYLYWPQITNADGSPKPDPKIAVSSPEAERFLSQLLPALVKHLEEKGWLDIYFQHLADEPTKSNAESYKKLSSIVRRLAPQLKIMDAAMCNEIAGAIDIWIPLSRHYEQDLKFFTKRRKAGDQVWFYTCLAPKGKYMNRFVDYPLIDVRLLHWMNFKYDLPGYLHWGFNFFHGDAWTNIDRDYNGKNWLPPGDSHIIYPGKRGPVPSIRLEALRDGVEDYELFRMLEKKNARKARQICDSIVRSMTDYEMDPVKFRMARMELIKALAAE